MARFAVILKETGEVSDIKLMEGDVLPEINKDAIDKYDVEEVDGAVAIGMVRGGPVHSVGGFGFPEGYTGPEPAGFGATRIADTAAADDRKPVSHEKQRGTEKQDDAKAKPAEAKADDKEPAESAKQTKKSAGAKKRKAA